MASAVASGARGDEREELMKSMAFPCVLNPILHQMEEKEHGNHPSTLVREALYDLNLNNPGFSKFFLDSILEKAGLQHKVDLSESILKLEGTGEQNDVVIHRREPAYNNLQKRANKLKIILGKIPHEINDRRRFLETIKDIAQAIKNLLDSVNEVHVELKAVEDLQKELDRKKREFVKYSKRFSTTLKEFFKDNKKHAVYLSANHLIHQTNQILLVVA